MKAKTDALGIGSLARINCQNGKMLVHWWPSIVDFVSQRLAALPPIKISNLSSISSILPIFASVFVRDDLVQARKRLVLPFKRDSLIPPPIG